jgi:hypothetical protein
MALGSYLRPCIYFDPLLATTRSQPFLTPSLGLKPPEPQEQASGNLKVTHFSIWHSAVPGLAPPPVCSLLLAPN